jgi:hypothetical protein
MITAGRAEQRRWSRRRITAPLDWVILGGLLAFLAVTNRWVSWQAGYRLLEAHDELDYRAIALASPRLPTDKLQVQHAQRFVPHYLIGLLGHLVSLDVVYEIAAVLVGVGSACLLLAVLRRIGVSRPVFAVCVAVYVLDAYSLRYYGLAPGELADLLLDAAILLSILGLLEQRFLLVVAGVAGGTLARQTMVPVAIAVAIWVLVDPAWRTRTRSQRLGLSAAILLVCGVLYAAVVIIATPFSTQTTPGFSHFTLLADLEALPHGAGNLGQHFLRCANDLFSVIALLAAAILVRRRSSPRAALPFAFWGCLLIAAAVILQPVVFSPQYAAHNETRLAVMGLGALTCCLAYLLRDTTWITPKVSGIVIALLALGSFHHIYTVIGTANAHQTVVLQALVALALAMVATVTILRERSRLGSMDA